MLVFAGGTLKSDHWLQFDIQKPVASGPGSTCYESSDAAQWPIHVKSDIEIDGIDHEHGNKSFPSFDANDHASPKIGFAEAETVHCGRDPCNCACDALAVELAALQWRASHLDRQKLQDGPCAPALSASIGLFGRHLGLQRSS